MPEKGCNYTCYKSLDKSKYWGWRKQQEFVVEVELDLGLGGKPELKTSHEELGVISDGQSVGRARTQALCSVSAGGRFPHGNTEARGQEAV